MNLWKTGALALALSSATAFGASESIEWKASFWVGGCTLRAEKSTAKTWDWSAPSYSKSRFNALWPNGPGELYLTKSALPNQLPLIEQESKPAGETLRIVFAMVDGRLTPVFYEYDNANMRLATDGLIQPHKCSLR